MGTRVEFLADPSAFLLVVGSYLAREPVLNTVIATEAHREAAHREAAHREAAHPEAAHRGTAAAEDAPQRPHWFLVVSDDGSGEVTGAGIRTARYAPYPIFLSPLSREAARSVAWELHARGETLPAVNGALPAARVCADELARLAGGRASVAVHTRLQRLHRLAELIPPAPVPGRLRLARADEAGIVADWMGAFGREADEQAGRSRGVLAHQPPDAAWAHRQIADRATWFWVTEDDTPVHLTGVNPPAFGVARIGPVYTPPDQRGRGWARAAVAEASRQILATGAQACLFTDVANPTSNRLYEALGYRRIADMANLTIA